jgi:ADP-ribose pyrophosphatase
MEKKGGLKKLFGGKRKNFTGNSISSIMHWEKRNMSPKHPLISSSETVYRGFFDLRRDRLLRPDGQFLDYTSVVIGWSAAVILAQDDNGRFILNREYRHPTGQAILGCPGGRIEKGEDPRRAAERELLEETGYWSGQFTLLGSCYPSPSLCNQIIFFFHAKDATYRGEKDLDPFEFIETELKTEEELRHALKTGVPIDSLLCAALWYKSFI